MARNSCLVYPQVNGEDSKMYKDALKIVKNRPQVNWLYAKYMATNAGDAMERAGYKRNRQGEFEAKDLLKYLDYASMQREMSDINLAEMQLGAVDTNGNRIDFTNAKDALEKADIFNDSHNALVATVYQHGTNIFNIHVSQKSARTHMQPTDVKEKLAVWEVYKQAFNSIGVDIENLPAELSETFNANNLNIARHLKNLKSMQFNYLYKKDAMLLLSMDPNSVQVQRFINNCGSLDAAAQAIDDINHGVGNHSQARIRLAMNAITQAQRLQGLDLQALQNQVSQMSQNVKTSSPEEDIRQTLHQLKKQYNIDINEIHLIGNEIKSLSQATAEAALQIQRQIRDIENQQGNMTEGKRLEGLLNQLLNELNNKKYYSGILNFLSEAQAVQADVDNMIINTPQSGTELERAFQQAKTLMKIQSYKDQYYPVISALADEATTIDESIGQTDIDNLRKTAKNLKDFFDKKEQVLKSLAEDTMTRILMEIIGDTTPTGESIVNIVKMAQTDSSIFDYLYSVGTASNPMIAAMGSIIRNAQDSRDEIMNDFSRRIRKATEKLHKSGSNTEFIYEDEEHIISDIDWAGYEAARKAAMKALSMQGLKGFDFKIALQNWEENNTEDRVVDKKTGRTEKVPNSQYRKAFPSLTTAQLEYYNTMMDIKGEIGSYLPAYAQRQYLAPQLRRNMVDALGKAKNAQDVWKAIKNKGQGLWKVREDDINYSKNGVIDGEEYNYSPGAFDNTPLRQIPIFFVNRVEEGELLKEFSTGLQHLAGTAINYDAMNNVASTVEFMGDFIKNAVAAKDIKNRADVVNNKFISVVKDLYRWGKNNNTSAIVDGFISQHIYGERRDPKENPAWQKLCDNLIGYTSFKGLATNLKGAFSNYLVGEFQMLIEAGCGEFYNIGDYAWAHSRLFGRAGVAGEIMEMVTNNMKHKATLFREMFDPLNENFSDKSQQRYHNNKKVGGIFRHLLGHDCAFIGYASGEYLIHYVNMYAILNHEKVRDSNGNVISLYDAFEVGNIQDENGELVLKNGVTRLDGSAIDKEYLNSVRNKIKYANQTTHGAMNVEDKGLIHRRMVGRLAMNFRQWMVGHYSRRFRGRHYDASLGMDREGYWTSVYKGMRDGDGGDAWRDKHYAKAIGMFMRDILMFTMRAQSQWSNLDAMQKNNVKRAHTELMMYFALLGLAFALGEPEEHKKEFWRRWWIYQTKRLILDTEASMPHPAAAKNAITILQSPMAGVSTANSMLYTIYGIDDITENIKSGPHKGENKYWRNIKKNVFPFFKDWEQLQNMDTSDAVFTVFSK